MSRQYDMFQDQKSDEFMVRLKAGETMDCPCCKRYSKIYKRKIHKTIAVTLIKLYRAGGDKRFLHFTDFAILRAGGEFALAKHWSLIKRDTEKPAEEKKTNGQWMLTRKGIMFVKCEINIPKNAYVFDDKCIGFTGEDVSIKDCLTDKFNYHQLMNS